MKNVIYFDGECGLCNGFVDFVLRIDKKKFFHFSPLQSEYAKKHLPEIYTKELKTIVVQTSDEMIFKKTSAIFTVLKNIGGVWRWPCLMEFLPSRILDAGYDIVAHNRYRIFGKKDTCRIPTPDERERFLIYTDHI